MFTVSMDTKAEMATSQTRQRSAGGIRARISRRWGWVVTMATFVIQFVGYGFLYSFGIINVAIQEDFQVGLTTSGWIPTIATGLSLMGSMATEGVIERTSNRCVGLTGTAMCFCACLVTSCMPSVTPMYVTFGILYGVGFSFTGFAGLLNIIDWFPDKNRAAATSIGLAGTSIGMLVLNPVIYQLVAAVGWRNTLRILGSIFLIVGCVTSASFSKPSQTGKPQLDDKDVQNSFKVPTLNRNDYDKIRTEETNSNHYSSSSSKPGKPPNDYQYFENSFKGLAFKDDCNYNAIRTVDEDDVEPITTHEERNSNHDPSSSSKPSRPQLDDNDFQNSFKDPALNYNGYNKIRTEDDDDVGPMSTHEEAHSKYDCKKQRDEHNVKNSFKEPKLNLNDYNKIGTKDYVDVSDIESMTTHERKNNNHDLETHIEIKFPEITSSSSSSKPTKPQKDDIKDVKNSCNDLTLNNNDSNKFRAENSVDAMDIESNTTHQETNINHDSLAKPNKSQLHNNGVKNSFKDPKLNRNDYDKIRTEDYVDVMDIEPPTTHGVTINSNHDSKIHLEILLFPEVWILFSAIMISEMSVTVFLFYWVNLLLSLGIHESTAALAMSIVGVSDAAGKFLIAVLVDRLPFPKLFLFHFACFAGIAVMLGMLWVDSVVAVCLISAAAGLFVLSIQNTLPCIAPAQVFPRRGATPVTISTIAMGLGIILGTVYGTSVDVTGSFNSTLYGCVAAYLVSLVLFSLVPLYQACVARDRYVLWEQVPRISS